MGLFILVRSKGNNVSSFQLRKGHCEEERNNLFSPGLVTRMKNNGLQKQQRWNTIKLMKICMITKPWNRLCLPWNIHNGNFLRLDKYLLCGVAGAVDLAFEQANGTGDKRHKWHTHPGSAFYKRVFWTMIFVSRDRFNTKTLEFVILKFNSVKLQNLRNNTDVD